MGWSIKNGTVISRKKKWKGLIEPEGKESKKLKITSKKKNKYKGTKSLSVIRAGRARGVQVGEMYLQEPGNWQTISENTSVTGR